MNELMEVLSILLRYNHENSISAEHDTIYLTGPFPDDLNDEERKSLERLNCFYDDSYQSWVFLT